MGEYMGIKIKNNLKKVKYTNIVYRVT